MSVRELINLYFNRLFQYFTVATESVSFLFTLYPHLTLMRVNPLTRTGYSLQTILSFLCEIHGCCGYYRIIIGNGQKLLRFFAEVRQQGAFKVSL